MKTVFESDRIRFVRVSEDLIADYLVMVNDFENVGRFIRAAGDGFFTEEQERAWVREKLGEDARVFSMIEKETGDFIGNIEFMDPTEDQAELGVAITAKKQDLGFGTEAVRAITEYGFEKLGFTSVRLRTRPYNPRAIRVYQKCGFREYDRSGEHVFMELKKNKRTKKTSGRRFFSTLRFYIRRRETSPRPTGYRFRLRFLRKYPGPAKPAKRLIYPFRGYFRNDDFILQPSLRGYRYCSPPARRFKILRLPPSASAQDDTKERTANNKDVIPSKGQILRLVSEVCAVRKLRANSGDERKR